MAENRVKSIVLVKGAVRGSLVLLLQISWGEEQNALHQGSEKERKNSIFGQGPGGQKTLFLGKKGMGTYRESLASGTGHIPPIRRARDRGRNPTKKKGGWEVGDTMQKESWAIS